MQTKQPESCPLCNSAVAPFYKQEFYSCTRCLAIFRPKHLWLTPQAEKARYEHHNNDIHDPAYRQFVSPITEAVQSKFKPGQTGLDFGAGTGSAIAKVLGDKGYDISQYDPFFYDLPELLDKQYDFIVCCEVMEHFKDPQKEFALLKHLLLPGGTLYCMTHIYSPEIPFPDWYYKNDPTHIFIYQKETMEWIRLNIGFSSVIIEKRLIKLDN